MPHRPEIFISATTKDLKSCRQLVRDALLTLGCVPVVQDHFAPDARTVREMLREKIAACDAVVHLAGECYGFEPQERVDGEARRSYTQMEYDAARALKKPVYTFLCADSFPYDAHAPEADDLRALQQQHRAALAAGDDLFVPVRDTPELEKSVRELQTRLEAVARDLRRTRSWLSWGLAAGLAILLVIGGLFYLQTRHAAGMERELAELRRQVQDKPKTDLVNEKLDRLLAASGGAKGSDPAATAREEAARQLGISVGELQAALADEHADLKQLLTRIDTESASALAQADQWKKLKREALTKFGNSEIAAGRYAASVEPYQQAVALVDKQKDPVAWCDTAENFANALWRMDRYDEAESLEREIVEHRTAIQGAEHGDSLLSLQRLATTLSLEKDYDAAESLFRRTLEADERVLGIEHPNTLSCLVNFAEMLASKGDYTAAEPLFHRALDAYERTLGKEHYITLLCVIAYGNTLRHEGNYDGAMTLFHRALVGYEHTLGKEDSRTAMAAYIVSFVELQQGHLREALPFAEEAVAVAKASLPENSPVRLEYGQHLTILQSKIVEADRLGR